MMAPEIDDEVIDAFLAPQAPQAPRPAPAADDLALEAFLASPPAKAQDDFIISGCLGPPPGPPGHPGAPGRPPPPLHDDHVMSSCLGPPPPPAPPGVVDDAIMAACLTAPAPPTRPAPPSPAPTRDDLVLAGCMAEPPPAPPTLNLWPEVWNAPRILAPSLRQQRLDDALRTPHTRSTLAAVEGQLPRSTSTDDFLLKAILDDALEPRPSFGKVTPQQRVQESQDDAALAAILGSPARGKAGGRKSGALMRLLNHLDRTPDLDVFMGGTRGGSRSFGALPKRPSSTSGKRKALTSVLETLSPSAQEDDLRLREALTSDRQGFLRPRGGVAAVPRSVLLSKVQDLLERASMMRRSQQAQVLGGGQGRGARPEQLCQPVGLALAQDGRIFVADCGNRRVVVLRPPDPRGGAAPEPEMLTDGSWPNPVDVVFSEAGQGSLLVSAGTGVHLVNFETHGLELVAEGCLPSGLLVDRGSLLFADAYDHCVLRCTWRGGAARKVVAGAAKDALPATHGPSLARLHRPFAVALDWDGTSLLVCDSGNHRVVRWPKDAQQGEVICGGEQGKALNQLNYPRAAILEPETGALLIADTFNHRLLRWRRGASSGELLFGRGRGHQLDQLNRPTALALDRVQRRLLIADSGNHRILSIRL